MSHYTIQVLTLIFVTISAFFNVTFLILQIIRRRR